jgi:acetyltransferase EpsM
MTKPVVIIGGGGDGLVVAQLIADIFRADKSVQLAGFLDDNIVKGKRVNGIMVLGCLDDWILMPQDTLFFPALHKATQMFQRAQLIKSLGIPDERWANLYHPTACIADGVEIGKGSMIGSYVTIQPKASIGQFVSIRAGANLGHGVIIEDFAYIGPNATMSGKVIIEEGAHVAPNAAIIEACRVGSYSVVGLGAAVTKNVDCYAIYMGNPARKIRTLVLPTKD